MAADHLDGLFGPERQESQWAVIAATLARGQGFKKAKPKDFLVWGDRGKGPRLGVEESQAHFKRYTEQVRAEVAKGGKIKSG